jgi:hypothetical protein
MLLYLKSLYVQKLAFFILQTREMRWKLTKFNSFVDTGRHSVITSGLVATTDSFQMSYFYSSSHDIFPFYPEINI